MELSELFAVLSIFLKFTTIYYVLIVVRWIFVKPNVIPHADPQMRFAIVIAARNEQAIIGRLVRSLNAQHYPRELFDIFVVPNNCTDDTAEEAFRAGANIILCDYPVRQKGDALRQAFLQLEYRGYDAYVVFDADNVVDPDYLQKTNDAFCAGARVVKGRQMAIDPKSSWVSGCYDIYFSGFDLFYNQPRLNAGLSAKLVGTGFALHQSVLKQLGGWNTETIAEDAEFAAQCALCEIPVTWVPQAITYDEEPDNFAVSIHQRKRWSSGVVQVGRLMLPQMMVFGKGRLCRDVFFFLLTSQLAPISMLFMLISTLLTKPSFFVLLSSIGMYWTGCCLLALFLQVLDRPKERRNVQACLMFPVFMLSWAPLQILALFNKTKHWREIRHGGMKTSVKTNG